MTAVAADAFVSVYLNHIVLQFKCLGRTYLDAFGASSAYIFVEYRSWPEVGFSVFAAPFDVGKNERREEGAFLYFNAPEVINCDIHWIEEGIDTICYALLLFLKGLKNRDIVGIIAHDESFCLIEGWGRM